MHTYRLVIKELDSSQFHLRYPIEFRIQDTGKWFYATWEPISLSASGRTEEEVVRLLKTFLIMAYKTYVYLRDEAVPDKPALSNPLKEAIEPIPEDTGEPTEYIVQHRFAVPDDSESGPGYRYEYSDPVTMSSDELRPRR